MSPLLLYYEVMIFFCSSASIFCKILAQKWVKEPNLLEIHRCFLKRVQLPWDLELAPRQAGHPHQWLLIWCKLYAPFGCEVHLKIERIMGKSAAITLSGEIAAQAGLQLSTVCLSIWWRQRGFSRIAIRRRWRNTEPRVLSDRFLLWGRNRVGN